MALCPAAATRVFSSLSQLSKNNGYTHTHTQRWHCICREMSKFLITPKKLKAWRKKHNVYMYVYTHICIYLLIYIYFTYIEIKQAKGQINANERKWNCNCWAMQTTASRDALMQNVGLNGADGGLVGRWVGGSVGFWCGLRHTRLPIKSLHLAFSPRFVCAFLVTMTAFPFPARFSFSPQRMQ